MTIHGRPAKAVHFCFVDSAPSVMSNEGRVSDTRHPPDIANAYPVGGYLLPAVFVIPNENISQKCGILLLTVSGQIPRLPLGRSE